LRRLKHILVILLGLVGATIVTLALVLTAFLAKPSWFLPKNPVPLAALVARVAGIHLKFPKGARLDVESLSFRDKRFVLDTAALCYDGVAPHVSGCFGALHAEVEVRLAALPPRLLKVGPVTARDGEFKVHLGGPTEEQSRVSRAVCRKTSRLGPSRWTSSRFSSSHRSGS
jgi:hypothetical protein